MASGLSPLLAKGIYLGPLFLLLVSGNEEEDFFRDSVESLQQLSISSCVSCPLSIGSKPKIP